jgi:hypothetical protein
MEFFNVENLSRKAISGIFILKILFGLILWALYTYYYKDRKTADIFKYFDDSKIMYDALFTHPGNFFKMLLGIQNNTPHFDVYYNQMNHWSRVFESNLYNDSHTIIRFNALLRIFSFGYYNVHTVFMCFISLSGLVAIYKTFTSYLKGKHLGLCIAVFFIPSVLFWGSGVLKEGFLFLGLGMLLYYYHKGLQEGFKLKFFIWIIIALVLMAFTKIYVLVAIVPGLIANFWISQTSQKNTLLKYLVVLVLYLSAGVNVYRFFPTYDPLEILTIKQNDFINLGNGGVVLKNDTRDVYVAPDHKSDIIYDSLSKRVSMRIGSDYYYWDKAYVADTIFVRNNQDTTTYTVFSDIPKSGSVIKIPKLEPTAWSFIKNTPVALFNTFFRPHLLEARSPLLMLPAMENLLFALVLIFCLFFYKSNIPYLHMALLCLSYIVILFAITGLTTPVLGAIVRYKVPGLPFLFIALLFILDEKKLEGKFKWFKSKNDRIIN